ncbi:MAG: hypothetical protein CM1200mP34_5180 [Verrucomicrobiales bacterium]|nr:MAG: hypothetical protein CM1200mP34_5180 [Verrucomicrobiales bacterium]
MLNLTGTATARPFIGLPPNDAAVIICYVAGDTSGCRRHPARRRSHPAHGQYFTREIEKGPKAAAWPKGFVDPGLGFYYANLQDSSVRIRHQIKTFLNAFRLRRLGWPVCNALPHAVECFGDEVRCAEPFFSVLAALGKNRPVPHP